MRVLGKKGVLHDTSVHYNPEQNVRVERDFCTLLEKVYAMLDGANLQYTFWTMTTARVGHNYSPVSDRGTTPHEFS